MDSNCLSRWEVGGEALLFSFSSAPGNFLAPRRAYGADAHRCSNVFCPDILSIFGKVKALSYATVKSLVGCRQKLARLPRVHNDLKLLEVQVT